MGKSVFYVSYRHARNTVTFLEKFRTVTGDPGVPDTVRVRVDAWLLIDYIVH